MHGYIVFYEGKRWEVYAPTLLAAKERTIAHYRVPKSKEHLISVILAEKDGEEVVHTPDF